MEEIRAVVASQNEIKVQAVHQALCKLYKTEDDKYVSVYPAAFPISSDVRDQPLTLSEAKYGALNRLKKVRIIAGFSIYAAIESGVFKVGDDWYENSCAGVIINNSRPVVAYGPSYPIPKNVSIHLEAGLDLSESMEIEAAIIDAGSVGGFNGWITEGALDQKEASAQAVLLALYGARYENQLR